jgi:hypothetical protein
MHEKSFVHRKLYLYTGNSIIQGFGWLKCQRHGSWLQKSNNVQEMTKPQIHTETHRNYDQFLDIIGRIVTKQMVIPIKKQLMGFINPIYFGLMHMYLCTGHLRSITGTKRDVISFLESHLGISTWRIN